MIERYIMRLGKYGTYLYDMQRRRSMTLEETVDVLNNFHSILVKNGYEVD